jgi:hypothetical protein
MKVLIVLVLVSFAIYSDALARPNYINCPTCGSGINPTSNSNCVCESSFQKVLRRYACGPACDAIGYCCNPSKCPACNSGVNPSSDSNCSCDAPSVKIFRKYPCGPACTAAGYCCGMVVKVVDVVSQTD